MKSFDVNLELQTIKTILDSKDSNFKVQLLARVNQEYFGYDQTLEIFKRITVFLNAGKDLPSSESMKSDHSLSEAARVLLSSQNANSFKSSGDIDNAVEILNKYRKARILYNLVVMAIEKLKDKDPDIDSTIETMETALQQCHSGSNKSEMTHFTGANSSQLVNDIAKELLTEEYDLIPTGFAEFDKKTGGFRKNNVITIASVPGGGKSAMAVQMAANQYQMGFNVCLVSFEMDETEIKYRLLSSISKIEHSKINLKRLAKRHIDIILQKWEEFLKSSNLNNKFTIWCPKREMNLNEVCMELKPYGFDIVYIDYIGLLKGDAKKAMWEQLGDHTRHAKIQANVLNVALILLAQYEAGEEKIKYSKAIVANSNNVWAWDNSKKEQESGIILVKQLKARNAPTYDFYLEKDMSVMSFRDYLGPPPFKDDDEDKKGKGYKKEESLPKMPNL